MITLQSEQGIHFMGQDAAVIRNGRPLQLGATHYMLIFSVMKFSKKQC
jgi:hypothetical protein